MGCLQPKELKMGHSQRLINSDEKKLLILPIIINFASNCPI